MKLTHLANERVIISRLAAVPNTANRFDLSTVTAAMVNLQALSPEKTQAAGGVMGKTFRIFADADIDIKENDQLKDESGNIYTVRKGAKTRWRHGAMDFLEIYITQS